MSEEGWMGRDMLAELEAEVAANNRASDDYYARRRKVIEKMHADEREKEAARPGTVRNPRTRDGQGRTLQTGVVFDAEVHRRAKLYLANHPETDMSALINKLLAKFLDEQAPPHCSECKRPLP